MFRMRQNAANHILQRISFLISDAAVAGSANLFMVEVIHDCQMPLRDAFIRRFIIDEAAVMLFSHLCSFLFKSLEIASVIMKVPDAVFLAYPAIG